VRSENSLQVAVFAAATRARKRGQEHAQPVGSEDILARLVEQSCRAAHKHGQHHAQTVVTNWTHAGQGQRCVGDAPGTEPRRVVGGPSPEGTAHDM